MKAAVAIALAGSALVGAYAYMASKERPVSVEEKRPPRAVTQVDLGRDLYQYHCSTCHGAGVGAEGRAQLPGTAALQEKYRGDPPALLEDRTDLTPETIGYFVRNGVSVMPFFRKTEVSDEDLAAISVYLTRPRPSPAK